MAKRDDRFQFKEGINTIRLLKSADFLMRTTQHNFDIRMETALRSLANGQEKNPVRCLSCKELVYDLLTPCRMKDNKK